MGMTQQELALRLGCARQTVVNYETGAREPSLSVLPRIASILQITIDQLFT
jgi:DNA-binding XRE family transcriptional regulator